jgi:hypothetical protein
MVVRDAFTHSWFLILGQDTESVGGFVYKAKLLKPNQYKADYGVGVQLVYGGYAKWVYVGPAEKEDGISPEEQKRITETERKRSNKRIADELRRGAKKKKLDYRDRNIQRLKDTGEANKVIPFKKKEESK